jgi:putative methionine-R-sulfoxide reductase with GAF domain
LSTELERIQKEKFKECLKGLPEFIMSGATYEQCLLKVLEECDWCFYTQEEDNLVKSIHSYFSKP